MAMAALLVDRYGDRNVNDTGIVLMVVVIVSVM